MCLERARTSCGADDGFPRASEHEGNRGGGVMPVDSPVPELMEEIVDGVQPVDSAVPQTMEEILMMCSSGTTLPGTGC